MRRTSRDSDGGLESARRIQVESAAGQAEYTTAEIFGGESAWSRVGRPLTRAEEFDLLDRFLSDEFGSLSQIERQEAALQLHACLRSRRQLGEHELRFYGVGEPSEPLVFTHLEP